MTGKILMKLIFIILAMNIRKKNTECNEINSVNPLNLRIKDMKGQFKKGKGGNVWHLIIFDDADVLRKFENIWKSMRAKIEGNTGGIVQYDKNENENKIINCQ